MALQACAEGRVPARRELWRRLWGSLSRLESARKPLVPLRTLVLPNHGVGRHGCWLCERVQGLRKEDDQFWRRRRLLPLLLSVLYLVGGG